MTREQVDVSSSERATLYDVIIRKGWVVDGTGGEPIRADVAVKDGKIAKVGVIDDDTGTQVIDAAGLMVSPGFIDIHTHADGNLLKHPDAWNYLSQGVTTAIGGNCGGSPLPIHDYRDRAISAELGINLGLLVGHNTVRRKAMGTEDRAPTSEELTQMKTSVEEAMAEGAFGLSSGLKYIPGAYARTEEVTELARVAARSGGVYATHMRDEGLDLIASVQESIKIGEDAEIPLQISHLKSTSTSLWEKVGAVLGMIDDARASGQDVTFDQYPYTASSTGLTVLFPAWSLEGGSKGFTKRWGEPDIRRKIREGIVHNLLEDRGGGDPANVVVVTSPYDASFNGRDLKAITAEFFDEVTLENVAETAIRLAESGRHACIFHCINEDNVREIMQHPAGLIASDSHIVTPDEAYPHPRNFGTFPRVLGHYVRELGVLSLTEAVRKMTGAVAQRLGMNQRGTVAEGNWADLVVFDPDEIGDLATWTEPKETAVGMHYVFVNGEMAIDKGQPTGGMVGGFLKRGDR